MTSPITAKGKRLSSTFAPHQPGTIKAAATGIKENGVDLADLYAKRSYGTAAAATGIIAPAGDLNVYFAAVNSTSYELGFNGGSYIETTVRAVAELTLNMKSNGTWDVVDHAGNVKASGTWKSAGGVASDYSVRFVQSGFTNGPDGNGGTTSYANTAAAAKALSATQSFSAGATGAVVNNIARNEGQVTAYLYKGGSLISTGTCNFTLVSSGN